MEDSKATKAMEAGSKATKVMGDSKEIKGIRDSKEIKGIRDSKAGKLWTINTADYVTWPGSTKP